MDSMPPASTTSWSPSRTALAASWMALRPLPQTLLMVRAETLAGRPPRRAAWRAGAWPTPAVTTWPKMASVGAAPGTAARRACTTWAARSGAERGARAPWNLPMGLRRDARMTAWDMGPLVWFEPLFTGRRPPGIGGGLVQRAQVEVLEIQGGGCGHVDIWRLLLQVAASAVHEGFPLPKELQALHLQVAEVHLHLHHMLLGLADDLLGLEVGLAEHQILLAVGTVQYVLAGALGLEQGLPEDAVLVLVLVQALAAVEDLFLQFLVLRQEFLPFPGDLMEEGPHFGFFETPEGLFEFPALDVEGGEFHSASGQEPTAWASTFWTPHSNSRA